jgi:3-methyladenine DNA glycosylase AlkD
MDANEVIRQLKNIANDKRKKTNEYFFKTGKDSYSSHDKFIGVSTPDIRKIAKQVYKDFNLNQVDKLINDEIHEIRFCALIIIVYKYQKNKKIDSKEIFDYYLTNIKSVNNWDLVDFTAPQIIGDYIYHNQNKLNLLFDFSKSNNLWEKRIAILATFAFIKNGEFKTTLAIAKQLLNDKHDLIHKAIGWMLREIYKKNAEITKSFLRENYIKLPRTTLRYAIEKMDKQQRLNYLKGNFYVSN